MPRLDYSGGASCPSLLLEPLRTNLVAHSEYLIGNGSPINSTLTSNETTSPENVVNASILEATAVSQPRFETSVSVSSTYSLSIFVKKKVGDYFGFGFYSGGVGNNYIRFNISTGSSNDIAYYGNALSNGAIEDFGNGWYRISAKLITDSNTGKSGAKFAAMSASYFDLGNVGDEFYLYGAQVELGASYPTSYIPTYGTSQTRSGEDSGTIDVSSLDVTGNYTLFYEVSDFYVTANSTWVRQNGSNGSALEAYGSTMIIWIDGGVWYPFGHGVSGVGSNTKKAITYDGVKVRAYSDGVLVGTRDADKNRWDNLTDFDMTNGSSQMVNWNQVLIFPTALTDSECIALTTL